MKIDISEELVWMLLFIFGGGIPLLIIILFVIAQTVGYFRQKKG